MSTHPLLRFTPSALPPADLEAILVKRDPVATATVELVRGFANGDGPPMRLFVGPRGMGKTHLISVIANRLSADATLTGRMQVAWLDEDPWRIRNYTTFLAEVRRSLTGTRVVPADLDEDALENWLLRQTASAPIVLVAENLDGIFERIGPHGQHRLRALIENTRRIGMVATSTFRFDELDNAKLPFYGMFEVTDLEPFTLDEATELVRRIAVRSSDQALVDFLQRPEARQRLQVVQHLTGGHPRIWLLLASSLSIDALDEVLPIFLNSLDQLTPFYQGRLAELSDDQQVIVMSLVDAEGAVSVKDIAALVQLEERVAAGQVGQLVRKGYLRLADEPSVPSTGDARRSYYELREPLMRLNLKVKEARGAPLEVVVGFLRTWFGARLLDRPDALGRHDEAFTACGMAIALARRTASAYERGGRLLMLMSDQDRSLRDPDRTAEARPDLGGIDAVAVHLLARDVDAAAASLRRSVSAWGTDGTELGSETAWLVRDLAFDLINGRLVASLVSVFVEAGVVEQLGNAIISTLPTLLPGLSAERLMDWQRLWNDAGSGHSELAVPLLLLNAGIEWWRDRDRGHLLALPQELRSVLEPELDKALARAPKDPERPKQPRPRKQRRPH
jgi:hypothetical protein